MNVLALVTQPSIKERLCSRYPFWLFIPIKSTLFCGGNSLNMPQSSLIKAEIRYFMAFFLCLGFLSAQAQENPSPAHFGHWIINTELSDNTDKKVERVLRDMGEKVSRCWLRCEEDRFRGGPAEQELYDRISYDKTLTMEYGDGQYLFTYDDNYQRPVYTDGRSRSVSLTGLDTVKDFSFAHWEGTALLVEARPRDGGFANETYRITDAGNRLRVEMYIHPEGFSEAIELVRVYDRVADKPTD